MSKLDRRVVRFVPGDFNPVAPGEIRRGAMVAVPVVSVRSASTCGHTPPSIPELVAVRWARVDTAGDGIFATFDSPSGGRLPWYEAWKPSRARLRDRATSR